IIPRRDCLGKQPHIVSFDAAVCRYRPMHFSFFVRLLLTKSLQMRRLAGKRNPVVLVNPVLLVAEPSVEKQNGRPRRIHAESTSVRPEGAMAARPRVDGDRWANVAHQRPAGPHIAAARGL